MLTASLSISKSILWPIPAFSNPKAVPPAPAKSSIAVYLVLTVDFNILYTDGGDIRPYSLTHNMIVWNVSGKNIKRNFMVRSPGMRLLNTRYTFKSELENINVSNDTIILNTLLVLFPLVNQRVELT